MLLADPPPTTFDLRFRLFGVDIRVHPFFWLGTILLGWNATKDKTLDDTGLLPLLIWVMAVFVSILLHEFGHVWTGMAFGSRGHIVLHGMGGLAIGSSNVRSSWQRVLVIAAGPAIQFALFAALVGLMLGGVIPLPNRMFGPMWRMFEWLAGRERFQALVLDSLAASPALGVLMANLLTINLLWPLLNLLPIWPLDGGQITREAAVAMSPREGAIRSLWLSLVVSAVFAFNAVIAQNNDPFIPFAPTGIFGIIMFLYFAAGSWQAIQYEKMARYERGYDDSLPWER